MAPRLYTTMDTYRLHADVLVVCAMDFFLSACWTAERGAGLGFIATGNTEGEIGISASCRALDFETLPLWKPFKGGKARVQSDGKQSW